MPIDIKEQATENLRFIRGAMERAERISSLSGIGGMLMGLTALCAMAMAAAIDGLQGQLIIWIAAAFLAATVGALASWFKARKSDVALIGDPGRRFLLSLLPVLAVAAVLTFSLWFTPQIVLVPGLWMMLYGCGVLAAGTYAVPPIMHMGGSFIVAGLFTYALPGDWGNLLLGTAFGGLHIGFGYLVYRNHGG